VVTELLLGGELFSLAEEEETGTFAVVAARARVCVCVCVCFATHGGAVPPRGHSCCIHGAPNAGYLRSPSAKFYASCVLSALAAMHSQHIVYRDLKPENVMMDEKGFAKVPAAAAVRRVCTCRCWL